VARKIKETPVLHGEDAKRFIEQISRNEQEPAPREEYERVMANYRKVMTADSHCGESGTVS